MEQYPLLNNAVRLHWGLSHISPLEKAGSQVKCSRVDRGFRATGVPLGPGLGRLSGETGREASV